MTTIAAPAIGFIDAVDTFAIGSAISEIGGGRTRADDEIDHAVGYASMARIGEKFKKNEPLGILYCRTRKQADAIGEKLQNAYKIAVEMPKRPKLIRTMV